MSTELKKILAEWCKINNQIDTLQAAKEKINASLINEIKKNDLLNYKLVLPTCNIKCMQIQEKEHITKKFLYKKLSEYFKGDEQKVKELVKFLYAGREMTGSRMIIRKVK